jgi:hypothetical protein
MAAGRSSELGKWSDFTMKIDVHPQENPNFMLWGKPKFFDFKTYPGAVVLQFENDVVMTIPMAVFEKLQFSVPDQTIKIRKADSGQKGARTSVSEVATTHFQPAQEGPRAATTCGLIAARRHGFGR